MASIHKDPRFKNSPWYAAYTLATGKRVFRSTKSRNKSEARIIAAAWETAEKEAARGELTKDRVSAILNETLIRLGQKPVERVSVHQWLEHWLASRKRFVSPQSVTNYSQAVREFLDFLGEHGAARKLETISEVDVQGFLESVRKSGRSATTVNKMRTYLAGAFG
jgi:hypothetical protein